MNKTWKIWKEENIKLLFSDYMIVFPENKIWKLTDLIFDSIQVSSLGKRIPFGFTCYIYLSYLCIFLQLGTVPHSFLVFHTLTVLKIIDQSLHRTSVYLGVPIRFKLCIIDWGITEIVLYSHYIPILSEAHIFSFILLLVVFTFDKLVKMVLTILKLLLFPL